MRGTIMSLQTEQNIPSSFADEAQHTRSGLASEFWFFLKHNKKWWMLPMLLVILLIGLLIFLGSTGAAPFIYTLF